MGNLLSGLERECAASIMRCRSDARVPSVVLENFKILTDYIKRALSKPVRATRWKMEPWFDKSRKVVRDILHYALTSGPRDQGLFRPYEKDYNLTLKKKKVELRGEK
ncbi:hypothetical protein NDU88_000838 [Pleurodeles waltl]|uniref:Uncharacterized protein n=1 Tax=Pleurodeles waltl TaxID=8319 RepID=A0AAV7S6C5_PLEWA|nr:hypothetical protein NDU88_000838 [Pleurodeles waltl]